MKLWIKVIAVSLCWQLFLTNCQSNSSHEIILGAYTAPREAFREINHEFEKFWQKENHEKVHVKASYLSSGGQSRAVRDGFEADVVVLALDSDVQRLVEEGLVMADWKRKPHQGVLSYSFVAFAVRPGNPHQIKNWEDLLKPGLKILTPNPKTSGGAQWNILAAYGAALRGQVESFPSNPGGGKYFLIRLIKQVVAMDKGARESILTFERGLGDVALTYEHEVIEGQLNEQGYELVVPRSTILVENVIAMVEKNVAKHQNKKLVQAYLKFLKSPKAQEIFAKHGFRTQSPAELRAELTRQFPHLRDIFEIKSLGGWQVVLPKFFGEKGIFTEAAQDAQKGSS